MGIARSWAVPAVSAALAFGMCSCGPQPAGDTAPAPSPALQPTPSPAAVPASPAPESAHRTPLPPQPVPVPNASAKAESAAPAQAAPDPTEQDQLRTPMKRVFDDAAKADLARLDDELAQGVLRMQEIERQVATLRYEAASTDRTVSAESARLAEADEKMGKALDADPRIRSLREKSESAMQERLAARAAFDAATDENRQQLGEALEQAQRAELEAARLHRVAERSARLSNEVVRALFQQRVAVRAALDQALDQRPDIAALKAERVELQAKATKLQEQRREIILASPLAKLGAGEEGG